MHHGVLLHGVLRETRRTRQAGCQIPYTVPRPYQALQWAVARTRRLWGGGLRVLVGEDSASANNLSSATLARGLSLISEQLHQFLKEWLLIGFVP